MSVRSLATDVALYRAEIAKMRSQHTGSADWWRLATEFFPWRVSLREGNTPTGDERPWVTFTAISKLESLIREGTRVFEYGAGGSTLFFLQRGALLVTVEHDAAWMENV